MKTLILSAIAAITLFISACNSNNTSDQKAIDSSTLKTADVTYTCPMHPEVLSNKPGKCPKCQMDLVQKAGKDNGDHTGHQH